MRKMHIGKVIRQRRKELGYTQEQLCEGICEPPNISRLENEQQIPSRSTMTLLLERLGLPNDIYFAYLSDNEAEIEDLQTEIVSCNMTVNSEQGLDAIERLEALITDKDKIVKQFILRSKSILGRRVDGQIVAYTESEKLEILYEALHLTSPKFDINNIKSKLYGVIEVKIINQIAQVHSRQGEYDVVIHIYEQLFDYVRTHMDGLKEQSAIIPMLAYNYARELGMARHPKEALEIAEIGRRTCLDYYQYADLGRLLFVIADCWHQLGEYELAQRRILESYWLYLIIECNHEAEVIQNHAKEEWNINPFYGHSSLPPG